MPKVFLLTEKQLNNQIARAIEREFAKTANEQDVETKNELAIFNSLQSQIDPHFLYNALESIRGQAILDKAPVIAEMAEALANYFRYSISSRSNIATLKEELRNVENYLKIQLFRFGNRFKVEINYEEDEDVLEAILPKLTLQPIIENSIIHGFSRLIKDACIKINITPTEKTIKIVISDNGVGMNESDLRALNEKIENYKTTLQTTQVKHVGIAMPNIDQRLKILFGKDYGIHVFSIEGIGTDVEIYIPYLLNTGR